MTGKDDRVMIPTSSTNKPSRRELRRRNSKRKQPYYSHFISKPRSMRRILIQQPKQYPMSVNQIAAVAIQSFFRGYLTRNEEKFEKYKSSSKDGIASLTSKFLRITTKSSSRMLLQEEKSNSNGRNGYQTWCAIKIQGWWRMVCATHRFNHKRYPMFNMAASQIQRQWRNRIYRNEYNKDRDIIEYISCKKIQDAWRGVTNRRIYHSYRDLINFRNEGDPREMLKSINPSETALFDAASGIHVRFRLGGSHFPPSIYYKIYTHQPVCDLGSFAPRDYTNGTTQQPIHTVDAFNHTPASEYSMHNDTRQTSIRVGSASFNATLSNVSVGELKNGYADEGWYHRYENNGWRCVTVQVLENLDEDPVTRRTRELSRRFHYSKLQRRIDNKIKKKNIKRKWMMKLYTEGMLRERGVGGESKIEGANSSSSSSSNGGKYDDDDEVEYYSSSKLLPDINFEDDNWENEAEDLLDWTGSLDYDSYVDDWKGLGTTQSSNPECWKKKHGN